MINWSALSRYCRTLGVQNLFFHFFTHQLPELITINDQWNPQPWFNTGGTRAKKYLQSPEGKFYYFKRSQYKDPTETKPGKDFKYEFWSEIIAYEVGTFLGFNVLRYDIAVDGEIMGCISESMIDNENEELIEGVKYLQAFSPEYSPSNKHHRSWYTFNLIINALNSANLGFAIEHLIETIVFDALIGNGDRHQENWAIITHQRLLTDLENNEQVKLAKFEKFLNKWLKRLAKYYQEKNEKLPKSWYRIDKSFAPIYDSGSSLGRELLDIRVESLLSSHEQLEKYIDSGLSEIHFEHKKVNHFDLIRKLMETGYGQTVQQVIQRTAQKFNRTEIERIIWEVDDKVPLTLSTYKLPISRKKLMLKIVTLRFAKLEALLNERI
jgi:hypothetical protein